MHGKKIVNQAINKLSVGMHLIFFSAILYLDPIRYAYKTEDNYNNNARYLIVGK